MADVSAQKASPEPDFVCRYNADTSAIYINYQHVVDYTEENNHGNAHLDYIIS